MREIVSERALAGDFVSARTDQPVAVDVRTAQEDVVIEPGMIEAANMAIDIREERESPVVIADEDPMMHRGIVERRFAQTILGDAQH